MAIKWLRGFRRIGWIVTVPLAAFFVLAFYEKTKEFSPSGYELDKYGVTPEGPAHVVEIPIKRLAGMGIAYFSRDVPMDVVEKILNDFVGDQKLRALNHPKPPAEVYYDDQGNPLPLRWMFTVHKQVSMLSLAGLVAGSVLVSVLFIQGFISVVAWVVRGFKFGRYGESQL